MFRLAQIAAALIAVWLLRPATQFTAEAMAEVTSALASTHE